MPRTWKFAVVPTEDKFTWALTADGQTVYESDDVFDDEASAQAEVDSVKKADVRKGKP
ncbi:MAG: hypothetical protein M3391_00235 [Actinomycetota bacterium]|nr:hypothetical protein [Actinomycetota bacterium]